MKVREIKQIRRRLNRFLKDLLVPIGRSERRQWSFMYVQGLLSDIERKTISDIARRFPNGNAQAIQQMLHSSPWDPVPVRHALTMKAIASLKPVEAWIVDDTGFPKRGDHSVGVARQYSGTLGKVDNCQVAVSLHYATWDASFPVDWSLYLPVSWTEDAERRKKAQIPEDIKFRKKWELALEMIDRALAGDLPVGVVTADAAYGTCTKFRNGLESRCLEYVVAVEHALCFWRKPMKRRPVPYQGKGRPPIKPRYDEAEKPESARQIADSIPENAWQEITYGQGVKGPLRASFAAWRVQPSHGYEKQAGELPICWLLTQKTDDPDDPYKFFVSNLNESTPIDRLARIAKLRWRIEQDYQGLKGEVGLDHYEGRSWRGWHHHVTLVTMAYVFLVIQRLIGDFPPATIADSSPRNATGVA